MSTSRCAWRVSRAAQTAARAFKHGARGGGSALSALLHERRELVEVLQHQRDVVLELNGLCRLERRLELRQPFLLLRIADRLVGFERRDLLLDLLGRLAELLGLRVDAGND